MSDEVLDVKESLFGSVEQVRVINSCTHVWWFHGVARIFGYMLVHSICVLCKTRRGS